MADLLKTLNLTPPRAIELLRPLKTSIGDEDIAINQFAAVCWSSLLEPGDTMARRLINATSAADALAGVAACIDDSGLQSVLQLAKRCEIESDALLVAIERWRLRFSVKSFRQNFESLARLGARMLTDDELAWPAGFAALDLEEPVVLFLLGGGSAELFERSVAVVGSRIVSPYGRWVTKEFCETLVSDDRAVVSGGALGVDAAAHLSTLNAGGRTIAMMAGGFDYLYPRGNESLFAAIRQNGLLCSELATGFAPSKWRFLQRNRLIAAASTATVVIEAGFRSGSISTASHAAAIGRSVGAVPGQIGAAHSAGCHRLIRDGQAILIGSNEQLMELVNPEREKPQLHTGLSDEQIRVFDAFTNRSAGEERIAVRAGVGLREVQMILAQLEIEGLVARNNDKWMRISRTL